jgi:hypothetical protein
MTVGSTDELIAGSRFVFDCRMADWRQSPERQSGEEAPCLAAHLVQSDNHREAPWLLMLYTPITVSPWMHYSLFRHVKRTIGSIKGCNTLEVVRSTLIGNQEWKKLVESAQ